MVLLSIANGKSDMKKAKWLIVGLVALEYDPGREIE